MIHNFLEILSFLAVSFSVGFVSAQVAKALDFGMDYKHFLWKIRFFKTRQSARKNNREFLFLREFVERRKIIDFNDRLNSIDHLYWREAATSSALTLWLCRVCLSHRIAALLSVLTAFFYLTANQIHFAAFFVMYTIAFAVNQYFIND